MALSPTGYTVSCRFNVISNSVLKNDNNFKALRIEKMLPKMGTWVHPANPVTATSLALFLIHSLTS